MIINPEFQQNRTFQGGAFHDSNRLSGQITLSHGIVHFEGGTGGVADLPITGLQIGAGGAGNRLVFLSHPARPDWTLFTPDRAILRHPALLQNSETAKQASKACSARRSGWIVVSAALLLAAAIVFGLLLLRPALTRLAAAHVPPSWEVGFGNAAFSHLRLQLNIVDDPSLEKDLEKIAAPLLGNIPDSPYPFQLHLAAEPEVNAFAIPGGHVIVNSGLIQEAAQPEEVAGVLAHEIAHVTLRHSLQNLIGSVGMFVVMQMAFGDLDGVLAVMVDNSSYLLRQKFSREYEREADAKGWEYLNQANIDPRGLERFFERLEKIEAEKDPLGGVSGQLAILATHPATGERIHWLQGRWKAQQKKSGFRNFGLNFAELKKRVRAAANKQK